MAPMAASCLVTPGPVAAYRQNPSLKGIHVRRQGPFTLPCGMVTARSLTGDGSRLSLGSRGDDRLLGCQGGIMPITPTYPGVYIEQLPSTSHSVTAAPTSVTVFIGYTHPFKTRAWNTTFSIGCGVRPGIVAGSYSSPDGWRSGRSSQPVAGHGASYRLPCNQCTGPATCAMACVTYGSVCY